MTIEQLVMLAGTDFSKKGVKQIFAKIYNCKDTFEETKLNWLLSVWKELAVRFEMPSSMQAEKDVIRDVFVFALAGEDMPQQIRPVVEKCCQEMSFAKLTEQLSGVSFFNPENMQEFFDATFE